jgi:hypothetical protein
MELFKFVYSLIVVFICVIIVLKTDRLFKLSLHQGIRYFRNAFFFYGIAFLFRYVLGSRLISGYFIFGEYYFIITILFEFFLVMAGFSLLYSLIWKKFEKSGRGALSSLFNFKMLVFYIMSLLIGILDFLWGTYLFMFLSQIIIFAYASILSYNNYQDRGNKHKFLKFYFIAMLLSFMAWVLNAILAIYLSWNKGILLSVYLINIIIFVLFLYGVVHITRRK